MSSPILRKPRQTILDPSRGYRISVAGEVTELAPANGTDFTLEELYAAIDCKTIEVIRIHKNRWMILDEEGKIFEKEVNQIATLLAQRDLIVGNVVICPESWLQ